MNAHKLTEVRYVRTAGLKKFCVKVGFRADRALLFWRMDEGDIRDRSLVNGIGHPRQGLTITGHQKSTSISFSTADSSTFAVF
jgi:hypothetical protein